MRGLTNLLAAFLICSVAELCAQTKTPKQQDWPVYGGTPENTHYSPLQQINRKNAKNLKIAWSYDTGEKGALQTNPIIVDGVLYGISPTQKIFALDAATGKLLWKFDSGVPGTQPDRGLSYWSSGKDKRILTGVMNFLYALDATTGKAILSFGDNAVSTFAMILAAIRKPNPSR